MKTLITFTSVIFLGLFLNSCKKESPAQHGSASTESMVLTPEGWRPKSQVHLIEKGYHLAVSSGHILKVRDGNGALIEDFGQLPPPGILLDYNSTNRKLNKGNTIAPSGNGWITWAEYGVTNGPISTFSTNWIVPTAPPSNDGQIIYIWNGLEPYRVEDNNPANLVIQPVLQWGSNGTFGGQYWSTSNWCVWSTGAAYTSPNTNVSPGTNLQGLITYNGSKADGSYNYISQFVNLGFQLSVTEGSYSNTSNPIPFIASPNWAYEVLEAANIYNTNDYPYQQPLIKMTNINMQTYGNYLPVNWMPEINPNTSTFQEYTQVVSNNSSGSGEVDLNFHSPKLTIAFGGRSGYVNIIVAPDVPSAVTAVLFYKDLAGGGWNQTAGSPYGWTDTFTPYHTYQFYVSCYGNGTPSVETSNTQTFTVPY